MHTALCHNNKKIQSAARQARGVMVENPKITGVATIGQLATWVMPKLDYPHQLGSLNERRDNLMAALHQMRLGGLISVHRKGGYARITRKGLHADRSALQPRSHSERRHGRRSPEPMQA